MHLKQDVGYALRQFAAAPGFTITAVLTLALGIGATAAIFTLVDAVMLKSLPVTRPSELYRDRSHYLNAIELKTLGSVPGLEPQVRRALAQVNPNLAVVDFTSFRDQVEQNFSQQKMIAKLTSLFGALALVLASVGLYGVTAYWVERRRREIGVRMALGADRLKVLKLVLRGAFLDVGIGLAIGIPATILAGRVMATQLFGVTPYDPAILLGTTAVLSLAALVAALVPARRAASLDPLRALRME